jgi:hypothetical protein
LLWLAARCTALRSRRCRSGVNTAPVAEIDDELTTFDRAEQDNPDGLFFGLRVGSRAAHRLGGRLFAAG